MMLALPIGQAHDSHSYYEFISTDSARNQSEAERIHFSISNHVLLRSPSRGPRSHAACVGCRGQTVSLFLRLDRDHNRRHLQSHCNLSPESAYRVTSTNLYLM